MLRTHTCGELNKKNKGEKVILCGWVNSRRDHGGLIFIDLRDKYGITQINFDPKNSKKAWTIADTTRNEFVIKVTGKTVMRPENMVNKKLATGEIEIEAKEIEILSEAETPPFEVHEEKGNEVKEELRMKYRYIDLRKQNIKEAIIKRHQFVKLIRDYLSDKEFLEIETPILGKSTPEGARDFLVPSRLHEGEFYALPQSPQQYKQFLMIGGMDKYFQIARCFRDEDTRGDRQAEFTQLDMEMSFIERDDILDLTEDMITKAIKKLFPEKKLLSSPWPRLDYEDVMLKYGTDKPDLRFGMKIKDVTDLVNDCGFKVFSDVASNHNVVRAICATGAAKFSRSQIDDLTELVKKSGAKGLAYILLKEDGTLQSPIVKFLGENLAQKIVKRVEAKAGDIIFFGADTKKVVCESLASLRNELGKLLIKINPDLIAMAFVINFPLFEEGLQDGHYAPNHHMFTSPRDEDIKLLETDPAKAKSYQYDMIGNGYELGGGSIRIHNAKIQEKIFNLIGFDNARKKLFSHFLRAFKFGVPPHGGIAPGIDRMLMVFMNKNSIRDVMAFPKTGDGRDLVMEAPSEVEAKQLKELGIKIV
ncbi:aspartate--tRNA ligase [Patescibacteria group bacterium]